MTEEGVAHFLLSLSLFLLFRLFLSFRRAYIYIYTYTEVSFLLSSRLFSLAALLSVRISNNTQATLAPLFAAAAHVLRARMRENIDQPYPLLSPPSQQPPWPHPPQSSVHPPPPMPTFSYQPPIPSRRFFISESPPVAVSSIPGGARTVFFSTRRGILARTSEEITPFPPRSLCFSSSLGRIGI